MQHLPQPRATSAAWLVMPPLAVRIACAACMPWTSSGLVSARTRMTFSLGSLPQAGGFVGGEDHLPVRAAGTGGQALGQRLARRARPSGPPSAAGTATSASALTRMTASSGLISFSLHHVHRDLHGGHAVALADAALEHEQPAFLDRELDVEHVAVVLLELHLDRVELLVGRGHRLFEARQALRVSGLARLVHRQRRADAGDDVLALRVREPLAVEDVPSRWPGRA